MDKENDLYRGLGDIDVADEDAFVAAIQGAAPSEEATTDDIPKEEGAGDDTPPIEEKQPDVPPVEPTPEITDELVKSLNGALETSYGSVDELKSILGEYTTLKEKVSQTVDYDEIKAQKEKLEQEKKLLVEHFSKISNPKEFFADELETKRNQILKENPNINRDVVGKALSIDLDKANPLDVIALNMVLTHSRLEGGEAGAKELLLDKYGLDEDFQWSELTVAQRNKINLDAEEASRHLSEIRDVKIPESPSDINDLIEQWKTESTPKEFDMSPWENKVNDVLGLAKTFEVKDGDDVLYSEAIDEAFLKESEEIVKEAIREGKLEPTKENMAILAEGIVEEYLVQKRADILKRHMKQVELKYKDEEHKKIHNDTDPDKPVVKEKIVTGKTTSLKDVLGY